MCSEHASSHCPCRTRDGAHLFPRTAGWYRYRCLKKRARLTACMYKIVKDVRALFSISCWCPCSSCSCLLPMARLFYCVMMTALACLILASSIVCCCYNGTPVTDTLMGLDYVQPKVVNISRPRFVGGRIGGTLGTPTFTLLYDRLDIYDCILRSTRQFSS